MLQLMHKGENDTAVCCLTLVSLLWHQCHVCKSSLKISIQKFWNKNNERVFMFLNPEVGSKSMIVVHGPPFKKCHLMWHEVCTSLGITVQ